MSPRPGRIVDVLDRLVNKCLDILETAVAAAVGTRGHWLAGLNPDWDYAAVSMEEADPAASRAVALIGSSRFSLGLEPEVARAFTVLAEVVLPAN